MLQADALVTMTELKSLVADGTLTQKPSTTLPANSNKIITKDECETYVWLQPVSPYSGYLGSRCPRYQDLIPITFTWEPDTFTCEQDSVFTEQSSITGLSSPGLLYYDSVTGRVYGLDGDNVNGPFFWYMPTATLASQVTYKQSILAPGGLKHYYASTHDPVYRRSYVVGRDTGGMNVYDWDSDTVSVVTFGTDGNLFNRGFVKIFDTVIICTDSVLSELTVIDRANLTVTSTRSFSSIPYGESSLYGQPSLVQVGSEIWVTRNNSAAGDQSPSVFCYDEGLTTLIREIDLNAYSQLVAPYNVYCRDGWLYDGMYYLIETGANNLIRINPANPLSPAVVYNFNNRTSGMNYTGANLVIDPISGDTFLGVAYFDQLGTTSTYELTYKWDFTTNTPSYIYTGTNFRNLTRIADTNELHGASPGRNIWSSPNTNWDTDGRVTKYTK